MELVTRRLLGALALLVAAPAAAQDCSAPVGACATRADGALALLAPGRATGIAVSAAEDPAVTRAAADLRADLARVGGGTVRLTGTPGAGTAIIAGTIGRSPLIDRLVRERRIDVGGVRGRWEAYLEQVVDNPAPGVSRALVIAGADRRGTVFGLYDVSRKAGVSPWNWWADVPVRRQPTLYLNAGRVTDAPVVKYRGIFINDEDPAFGGWAKASFGGVNHQAYAHLFELILRLKGNFLWPAMWGKSLWQDDPASAPLAKSMGIVLGTSHHEPMERANIEWKRQGGGAWDYTTNAPALRDFWRKGIERRGASEDLVTVGMRGDGDEPMTKGTATKLLERIVADQRTIIADVTRRPAAETPQVWALYKEVQDYYDAGMRVPDDVTLLFSDDNWGNIRRLPQPGVARAGGYGVYYHFDYVGDPRNYKWVDTNAVPRVWQQMAMAHAYGADRLWIVNVGDLKPMEYATSFFLDMAWNPDRMTVDAMAAYPRAWAARQFGADGGEWIGELLLRYGQLASRRKPELVDADSYSLASGEWARVLGEWSALEASALQQRGRLPADAQDAYDELVLHRVQAMANLHRLYEAVAENRAAAAKGDAGGATRWGDAARGFFARDAALRRRYEGLAGGKWTGMMAQTHIGYTGWQQPDADVMPALASVGATAPAPAAPPGPAPERKPLLTVAADQGGFVNGGGSAWQRVPGFTAEGAAVVAMPSTAAPVERPGGASARLDYPLATGSAGPVTVSVVAAPGLDVTGHGHQRFAVSIDDGAPVMVDLLAGENDARWRRAVADNRRTGTATLPAPAGRHTLHLWLVDPQLVFEHVSVTPAG